MKQIVSIQVLRAIAALAIALLHALNDASAISQAAGRLPVFAPIEWVPLSAGVDLFFVISGFVMVYASQSLFGTRDGSPRFLVRRITRIVPLYWLATTLFLLVALMLPGILNSAPFPPWQIAASYLFIPFTRADGLQQPILSLGWSLNYEMLFYLVFALFIARARADAVRATTAVILALVAIGFVLPSTGMPFAFWCNSIMLEFVFGLWLAEAYVRGWRIPLWGGLLLIASSLALLHVDATTTSPALPRAIAWGVPAAMLLVGAVFVDWTSADGPATRVFVAIGDASYALYLMHPFAMRGLKQVWLKLGLAAAVSPWIYVAVTLALAVALSIAVFRLFEKPTTQFLNARFSRRMASARG